MRKNLNISMIIGIMYTDLLFKYTHMWANL